MHNTRRHQPTTVKQCVKCPNVFMTVGAGPSATDIRLAFPRPVDLDRYGSNATGKCPLHPRPLVTEKEKR